MTDRNDTSQDSDSRKQPVQANDGRPHGNAPDGVSSAATQGRGGKGESGGGAYPNPHQGKKKDRKADPGSFMGHGGQSDMAYHGTGQLGETDVPAQDNDNSSTISD
ncbi:hypothetical protein [Sphingobium lignivorans]|uniref:Uncharacterized protein n=1 Tax=Sphingobium lignivorans TaxID=2735886 RepID=A0ABR6NBH6_9SPHN|nr:hypothetical protein [Sphingobium lignivorans]MBB5984630.1 hypothetical protein [Sphingobium lignivorans]